MIFLIIGNTNLNESEKCKAIEAAVLKNPELLTRIWLGWTPLHYAVTNRLPTVIKLLLKLGCAIDMEDTEQQTPLHHAVENGLDDIVYLLGYHGCNFNKVDKKKESALHKAIIHNQPACVEALFFASKFAIQKDLVNDDGQTAENILRCSSKIKSQAALGRALTMAPDLFMRTPLQIAVINEEPDLVQLHLGLGASINEQDGDGKTALHLAALCGHEPILLLLCYHDDIKMNLTDNKGNTALHSSIEAGQPNCVKILVSAKKPADKYIKNNDNLTALDLIDKWKNKDLVLALEKALMSTQLRNGLSEQYEKEVFFEHHVAAGYMSYLKNNFKELEFSVKTFLEERGCSRTSSDGSTFKRFGMSLSPRKQSSSSDFSKSSFSSSSEHESFGDDDSSIPKRKKTSNPHASPREKSALSSSELTTSDKEMNGGDTPLPIRRKKSSPRTKYREQLNLPPEPTKHVNKETNDDLSFPKLRKISGPHDKGIGGKATIPKFYIGDRILKSDELFLEDAYSKNDINAMTHIIKSAKTNDEIISLGQKLHVFIGKYSNERVANLLLSSFNELKPLINFEKDEFDKKCSFIRKALHKKLLFEGLKNVCNEQEINKLTQTQFSLISTAENTIKNLEILNDICSGTACKTNYIIELNLATTKCLGLSDFVEPHEIISLLIKLNPLFSNIQRLLSHYLVFTLIELHDLYGYGCAKGAFAKQINLYIENCCETRISQIINEYKMTIINFEMASIHSLVKQFKPSLVHTMSFKNDSINEKINEFVNQNMSNLKHRSALELLHYITREFNIINARFYQNCNLKEFRNDCWKVGAKEDIKTSLSEFSGIITGIFAFVINTINSFDSPQKQAQAISLFVFIARESLHYQHGPDLITLMAINVALVSCEVSRLKEAFELLDKNTYKIMESLSQLATLKQNFKYYRELIAADQRSIPFIPVIFKDKTALYEFPKHEILIEVGNIYHSLFIIKKNLSGLALDSRSDLLERFIKNIPKEVIDEDIENNKKQNLKLERTVSKNKGLLLFASNIVNSNLTTLEVNLSQRTLNMELSGESSKENNIHK